MTRLIMALILEYSQNFSFCFEKLFMTQNIFSLNSWKMLIKSQLETFEKQIINRTCTSINLEEQQKGKLIQ
jgi:hypothetical protein